MGLLQAGKLGIFIDMAGGADGRTQGGQTGHGGILKKPAGGLQKGGKRAAGWPDAVYPAFWPVQP